MGRAFIILFILIVITVMSGCGGNQIGNEESTPNGTESSANADAVEPESENGSQHANELDAKRKAEPRQVPQSFPLPLLPGWTEGEPFAELTTGKKEGWFAEYFFEDDLDDNVAQYEQRLVDEGYDVTANALVSSSLGKGYIVKGHISGIRYSGSVVFDTNAEGKQRVWMSFTEVK